MCINRFYSIEIMKVYVNIPLRYSSIRQIVVDSIERFIDDLVGAIYDFFKFIFTSICYLLDGMLIVGVPHYLIALIFNMFN